MVQDPNQSSFGLTPNVAAGLASFFMGIGGLVILLGKPPQQWVRFVAVQSIVLAVVWIVVGIALRILGVIFALVGLGLLLWSIISVIYLLVDLLIFAMWIVQTIKAFQGGAQRFPIISDWTDRFMPVAVSVMASTPSYTAPPRYTPTPPPAQTYTAPPPPTPPTPPEPPSSL
jgi:uncharacterized membrane protein